MMKAHSLDKDIPVIVGEHGCFGDNQTSETRQKWTLDVAEACVSRDMCPVLWDTPGGECWRDEIDFPRDEFIAELVGLHDYYNGKTK